MKKLKMNKVSIAALALVFAVSTGMAVMAATQVNLGVAEDFAVLAGSAITDANPVGVITGDAGLSPAGGASITGLTSSQVSGTIYAVDAAGPDGAGGNNPGLLTTAKNNLGAAYTNAAGQGSDFAVIASTTDSFAVTGYTLEAGVYTSASTMGITGTLTLDGENDPNAVFIFQAGSTLTTATNSEIVLINGAQACNIFWQVGTSATLGTTTDFAGTIMAAASITDNGGADINGRLLADADNDGTGAVTLSNTDVAVPVCASSLTLLKTVINDDGGTASASDWTLTAAGPSGFAGAGPTISSGAPFDAGTYDLSETGLAGYTASDWACVGGTQNDGDTVSVAVGQSVSCTIANDDIGSSGGSSSGSRRTVASALADLHIIKQVINDNGGILAASDFNLYVKLSGDDVSGSPAAGMAAPGRSYDLPAGEYVVSEGVVNGYAQSFSGDCDSSGRVTLSSGDDETCIVTNDDIATATTVTSTTTTFVPGLPATGLPPRENGRALAATILAGMSVIFTALYFIRKRQIA